MDQAYEEAFTSIHLRMLRPANAGRALRPYHGVLSIDANGHKHIIKAIGRRMTLLLLIIVKLHDVKL